MLFPLSVVLSASELTTALEYKALISQFGFIFEQTGSLSVHLTAVPADLPKLIESELFLDLLTDIQEDTQTMSGKSDTIALAFAKRVSSRNVQPRTPEELKSITNRLFQCRIPYRCPDGKATMSVITLAQLDEIFDAGKQ